MKVLFIGGTGIISSACTDLALERGIDLTLLNRGQSQRRAPEGAREIIAWFDEDPARQQIDLAFDALSDRIIEAQRGALP